MDELGCVIGVRDDGAAWTFTISTLQGSRYTYTCPTGDPRELFKLRNLWISAGFGAPKRKSVVDPKQVVGGFIGLSCNEVGDVDAIFPPNELEWLGAFPRRIA